MPRPIDITGRKFGRLTVVSFAFAKGYRKFWNCLCECGNVSQKDAGNLRSGRVRSCGCLNLEKLRARGDTFPSRVAIGDVYGRLTVIELTPDRVYGARLWRCRCVCGRETIAMASNLTSGCTTSCGCRRIEVSRAINFIHGMTNTGTYRSWTKMKARCLNPNSNRYAIYGGRGVVFCEEWKDFSVFLRDMGPRPLGTSLDRRDVNGPYCKDNCRWADATTQANNRRPSQPKRS
jgi:hypothetical protein